MRTRQKGRQPAFGGAVRAQATSTRGPARPHSPALVALSSRAGNAAVSRLIAGPAPRTILRGGILEQPAPGEGGKEYGEHGSKGFSDLERMWIDDVMANPLVTLVFSTYGSIPPVILHRVSEIETAHGEFSPGKNEMAISDKPYEPQLDDEENPKSEAELEKRHEASFKGTLLHEIFHYIEDNTKDLKENIPLPRQLMGTLVGPEAGGFDAYAFGWFLHPGTNEYLHFETTGVKVPGHPRNILGYPDLEKVCDSKAWEPSPMQESGHSVSPEEDMAESFSQLLLSKESRDTFIEAYPRRSRLLGAFLAQLKSLQATADRNDPEGK